MAKTTKKTTATAAALDAAADSAKKAMKVAKTLPQDAARKMRSLADEAKKASSASKKSIKRNPGEVVGRAIASVANIATEIGGIPKRRDSVKKSSATTAISSTSTQALAKKSAPIKAASKSAPSTTSTASKSDLSSLTVAQLKDRAQKADHTGYSRLTKAELIDLLSS